jgi:hypothetical protein
MILIGAIGKSMGKVGMVQIGVIRESIEHEE